MKSKKNSFSLWTQVTVILVVAFAVHFISQALESFFTLQSYRETLDREVTGEILRVQETDLASKSQLVFSLIIHYLEEHPRDEDLRSHIQLISGLDSRDLLIFPLRELGDADLSQVSLPLRAAVEENSVVFSNPEFRNGESLVFRDKSGEYLSSFRYYAGEGLVLGFGLDLSNYIQLVEEAQSQSAAMSWDYFIRAMLTTLILIVVVAIFTVFWINRKIFLPLNKLSRAFELLGAGDYRLDLDLGKSQEFKELAKKLNLTSLRLELSLYEIKSRESQYKSLIENIPQKIFLKDKNLVYVSCNTAFARDHGIDGKDILGKTEFDFFDRKLAKKFQERENRVMEKGEPVELEEKVLINGQWIWIHSVEVPVRYGQGKKGILGISWETTKQRAQAQELRALNRKLEQKVRERTQDLEMANAKLEKLSRTDPLIGIGNRRAFQRFLIREWRQHRRFKRRIAMIMIDIDHFKLYNDHYGHTEGDEVLRAVGKALREVCGRAGDLAARYGGEEFGIILTETDLVGAMKVAKNIEFVIRALKIPHGYNSAADILTLSMGVASAVPEDGDPPVTLVKLADEALYRAKEEGRNRIVAQEET